MEEKSSISFFRSLKGKLILFFILVGAIPALVIGAIGYSTSSSSMKEEAFAKLEAIHMIKASQIESYLGERLGDVSVLSSNDGVIEAFAAFSEAFAEGGLNSDKYRNVEAKYGPWLTQYEQEYGYYDLFLIGSDGEVVYTVEKMELRNMPMFQTITSP